MPKNQDLNDFLKSESTYRKLGFQYRRGILLYGPPGNGKTALIRELVKSLLQDSIVIYMVDVPSKNFLSALNRIERKLKVFIFEELVQVIENSRIEELLDFLDGEHSVDESVVIATTNYPDQLPANIADRPSRFDRIYEIKDPSREHRRAFLKFFTGIKKIESSDIESTKGLSVAGLREVALLCLSRGYSIEKAANSLLAQRRKAKKRFSQELRSMGFKSERNRSLDEFEFWSSIH